MRARHPFVTAPVGVFGELRREPDRLGGAVRITIAAVLVTTVMLAFRMPFLSIGPYLVFILSQRDTLLTRAAAILGVVVGALACILVWLVVILAWDVAWLRVSMLTGIFFAGYYMMRVFAEPRVALGALVVLAFFTASFDTVPYPNVLLDQLGWIWAAFGLIFVATFLTQWLFRAPTALEVLRSQMRRTLAAAEGACLEVARGRRVEVAPLADEREDAAVRIRMLAATKILQPGQAARCSGLLDGCNELFRALVEIPSLDSRGKDDCLSLARWLRKLRLRVFRGAGPLPHLVDDPSGANALRPAIEKLGTAAANLSRPVNPPQTKPSLLPADWRENPTYASFATRATLATMTCYLLMTLTAWGDIHTCMITCVVTALVVSEERELKQYLRIAGALVGGALGIAAVIFLIPIFDSFMALLLMLAAGTMLASWVALGSKRISYAGWQIALAFYMTILQDPHPVTKLDVIRDRWIGILLGIVAMRVAFSMPGLQQLALSRDDPSASGAPSIR